MRTHIYKIYFPTSKKCYIGWTYDIKRRMFRHLRAKSLVGNALRKYDDWAIEILHTTKDRDSANLLEIEEIRHYNCIAPNGYNLSRGGDGGALFSGHHHTEEAKEKQRKGNLGNQNGIGNKGPKGRHWKWSEKSKEKRKGADNLASYRIDVKIKRLRTRIKKLKENI